MFAALLERGPLLPRRFHRSATSLGQMVAGMAHEINTPLGYVRNNVEMPQGVLAQLGGVVQEQNKLTRLLADGSGDDDAISQQLAGACVAADELKDSGVMDDAPGLLRDTLYGVDRIESRVVSLRNFSRLDPSVATTHPRDGGAALNLAQTLLPVT